jgi:phosphoesterase RecJ-like protein
MAAASELTVDLLLNWKGTTLSKEAARYFYIGLVGDSGRFQYSSTTAHTFAIAQASGQHRHLDQRDLPQDVREEDR